MMTSSNGNIFRVIALCAGNSQVICEFPAKRPVTRSFGVFFDLRLNKRLSKQSWGWWFETPSSPLWRPCNTNQETLLHISISHLVKLLRNGAVFSWSLGNTGHLAYSFLWSMPISTVYPKKYAHGFVVLCFVGVMQSLIMNSHEVFIRIHQGCFAGTGAIVRLPQRQWSKPDEMGKSVNV